MDVTRAADMTVNHGPGLILPGLPGGEPYVSGAEWREFWKAEVAAVGRITSGDYIRAQQFRRLFEVRR